MCQTLLSKLTCSEFYVCVFLGTVFKSIYYYYYYYLDYYRYYYLGIKPYFTFFPFIYLVFKGN